MRAVLKVGAFLPPVDGGLGGAKALGQAGGTGAAGGDLRADGRCVWCARFCAGQSACWLSWRLHQVSHQLSHRRPGHEQRVPPGIYAIVRDATRSGLIHRTTPDLCKPTLMLILNSNCRLLEYMQKDRRVKVNRCQKDLGNRLCA